MQCSISSKHFIPLELALVIYAIVCLSNSPAGQRAERGISDRRQYLDELGKKKFPDIARKLGVTVDQVQQSANFIATLDPKPGQIFSPEPNSYVLPDVMVEKIAERLCGLADRRPNSASSNQ